MPARKHLRTAITGATIILSSILPAQTQPAPLSVTAVRYWSLSEVTRIAIETTGDFQFRSDRALNPDRLFFDLFGARLKMGKKGQHVIAVGDRLIKQIRVAETLPGVTRVVCDLETGVEFSASQLTNPNRLIIELRPANGQAPAPAGQSVTRVHSLTEDALSEAPAASAPPKVSSKIETPPALVTAPVKLAKVETPAALSIPANMRIETAPNIPRVSERTSPAMDGVPKPAKLPRNGDRSLTRVLGLKVGRIVLDAGHGGHDTGTLGAAGLMEKDLVLDIAKRLGALIESRLGSEVIYTRSDDTFIPLEVRTQIANDQKADLFLSVHANSSPLRSSSGVETYYLNFTTSQAALEVAARENASSQKTVYELKDLLQKIALKDKVEESREFASRIQSSLHSFSARGNSRVKDRGVKKAPFVVLIGAQMPSVLAEIGFVSNPRDEGLMKRPEYRQKMAEALYKGLSGYAATLSQFQVAARK